MTKNEELLLEQLSEEFQIAKDINAEEHIKLLNKLESYSKEESIAILNYFLTKETKPQIILHIIKMIGKHNDKSSAEALIHLLLMKEKNPDNLEDYLKPRCMAATVLGNLKENNSVLPLLYVLNNKNENYKLRLNAAEALGRIGDKYAVLPLIEVVTDEEEKSVYLRESAAKALGMLGDIRAISPLVTILETKKGLIDKFTFLKERIIETLGRIGFRDDRTLKVLKNALLDESPYIRLGAIEALSEIDDNRVLALIKDMINDPEEDVARGAIVALYQVAGEEYIKNLLKDENLQECCKNEIEILLSEEELEEEEFLEDETEK